jgi:superfamily II DNA or RNA helicase
LLKNEIRLRDYQLEGISNVEFSFKKNKRVMLCMPTGTGKTVTFSSFCKRRVEEYAHVLICVHRNELVEQIQYKLRDFGMNPGLITAGAKKQYHKQVQVASIQTLARRNAPSADYIIIDECHHARAETYQRLWDIYSESKILGVTATPVRSNGDGFDDLFEDLIKVYNLKWFIEKGFLVKPKTILPSWPDFSHVPTNSDGDFDSDALNKYIMSSGKFEQEIDEMIKEYKRYAPGLKTVVFARSIEHSKAVVEGYKEAGFPAAHIDANTDSTERKRLLRHFKEGKVLVLSNVDIISEGFDCPNIECVQMLRPTKSLSLYMQMIGRVLRPTPGKSEGLILDHVGNWHIHSLMPGQDVNWSLAFKPKKRGEPKGPALGTTSEMRQKIVIRNSELVEVDQDMENLLVFESLLKKALAKKEGAELAFMRFMDFMQFQEKVINNDEEEYLHLRATGLNINYSLLLDQGGSVGENMRLAGVR